MDLSPIAVIHRLADLSKQLDATQRELDDADSAAVISRHAYEIAYARSVLSAEGGNAEQRKASATIATEAERFAAECADQVVRSLRSRLTVLRVQVEVGRSLNSALRAEVAA